MMQNREELADILTRIVPETATNEASLREAVAHAVQHKDEVMAKAKLASSGSFGFHASREVNARFVLKGLVAIRDQWLKEHGAYLNG